MKIIGLVPLLALAATGPRARAAESPTILIDTTPAHVVNTFSPARALGAGIDRLPSEATDALYDPAQLRQVLSAGWQTVSYRLNTELKVEAWHWNPEGTWSDPAGRGYFVGNAMPGAKPIRHSLATPCPTGASPATRGPRTRGSRGSTTEI